MAFIANGGGLVDQNTANLRAAICAGCHSNKSTAEIKKSCSVCNKMARIVINKFRAAVIKDNKTPYDGSLLACEHCGCDNKISVWIPNKILLSKEDANAFPSFCYKKAVLEDRDIL